MNRFEKVFSPLFNRVIRRMNRGAKKHGPRWPSKSLAKYECSFIRHVVKFLARRKGEDHAAAIVCNLRTIEKMRKA